MLPLLYALLVFPPGTTLFPGGNKTPVSHVLSLRFRREPFAPKTQPWKGWSVIFSMCEAHAVAFALVVAFVFAAVVAADLAVADP